MVKFVPMKSGNFILKLASTKEEMEQLFHLRYEELLLFYNKNNKNEDHLFIDEYDHVCDHLICYDTVKKQVAGTYRLVLEEHIKEIGSFITESEYDITKLKSNRLLELGRAVVKEEYRDGSVIRLLWRGLIKYALIKNVKYLFGTGSFHGQNLNEYDHALSYIYYNHLSSEEFRVKAQPDSRRDMNLVAKSDLDNDKIKEQMPALIKGYIKVGATFGEDVYIDVLFNSIDVFVLVDIEKVNPNILKRFLG